ncbi:hypothetical protein ACQ9ZH_21050 [Pseudomonas chlororaphis]
MQKLTINKNVYDTMLGHFGDKLETIAKEFNEYLTPENVVNDYKLADNTIKSKGSMGKMITFISHLEPAVKNKLNCKIVKQLDFSFEYWFEGEHEPDELLGKYFQLFIIRKLDYFGTHIISTKDEKYDAFDNGIHSNFLSLCEDTSERRIVALMGILFSNCSVADQKRMMTIIKMKFKAEDKTDDKFKFFSDTIDLFIHAEAYKEFDK